MLVPDNTGIPYLPFCLEGYQNKYALKDLQGNLIEKTPKETFRRVADALGTGLYKPFREAFYRTMCRGGTPAGRILSNAGSPYLRASLINCTVSRTIEDSMEGIFEAVKEAAMTLSSGSGIGYCFSTLRPESAPVTGVGAYSSGPLSFMRVFDAACQTIFAGGGRRGAQMGTFWVYHPDIFSFITAKKSEGVLRSMNVSVLVDDRFMEAVKNDEVVPLVFPALKNDPPGSEYVQDHFPGYSSYGHTIPLRVYRRVRAREIWDAIMRSTFEASEPGILFYDRINKLNPLYFCEDLIATNPCGEQPLPQFGACNLGSLNLAAYVQREGDFFEFDRKAFKEDAYIMHILLDAVCDSARLALPQQQQEMIKKRRHGLGIMGLGSTLALLGCSYDAEDPITQAFCHYIGRTLVVEGFHANAVLAEQASKRPDLYQKRPPFLVGNNLYRYLDSPYWKKHLPAVVAEYPDILDKVRRTGLRFTHATAIAPTGTIALYMGNNVSNGIEPTFRHEYIRNIKVAGKKILKDTVISSYEYRRFRHEFGEEAPIPQWFSEAHTLPPQKHIGMQALFQNYIDSSISKTINVPHSTSYEEFKKVYTLAYDSGCKGCTTFRFNPDIFHGVLISPEDLKKMVYTITLKDGTKMTLRGNDRVYLPDIDEEALVANLVAFYRKET